MVVNEIFFSLQGECLSQGAPTTFIRFAGCNMACEYCDTLYAQGTTDGQRMSASAIVDKVRSLESRPKRICLTGGEPLLQPRSELQELLFLLQECGVQSVAVETNGSQSVAWLRQTPKLKPDLVRLVVDYKLGTSRGLMVWENYTRLQSNDVLKFVCSDQEEDFERVHSVLTRLKEVHSAHPTVYIHAINGTACSQTAAFVMDLHLFFADAFDIRYGIQLHKLLWGNAKGK